MPGCLNFGVGVTALKFFFMLQTLLVIKQDGRTVLGTSASIQLSAKLNCIITLKYTMEKEQISIVYLKVYM